MREGDWAVTPLGDSSGKGLVEDGVERGVGQSADHPCVICTSPPKRGCWVTGSG